MGHAMKVAERTMDKRREIVDIDGMQLGYMKGNGIMDAIWIVNQIQEKMLERNNIECAFVHWGQAVDRVHEEVIFRGQGKRGSPPCHNQL